MTEANNVEPPAAPLLKDRLRKRADEEKSLQEKIYNGSDKASTASSAVSNTFGVIAAAISANKDIPVVGFVLQMISMIPKSIAVMTDPQSSIGNKIFVGGLIAIVFSLAITAAVIGAVAGAIIGTVIGSIMVVLEGLNLLSNILNKFKASSAEKLRKEYDAGKNLGDPRFTELSQIQAVELCHKAKGSMDELICAEDSPAQKLKDLYAKRDKQMSELTEEINKLELLTPDEQNEEQNKALSEINKRRKEIVETDASILEITAPPEELEKNNQKASAELAMSYSSFAMNAAGVVFSVIGLLLALAAIPVAPVLAPIMIGIGITMAVFGLIKFTAEKIGEYQDKKEAALKLETKENEILDEAQGIELEVNPKSSYELMKAALHDPNMIQVENKDPTPDPRTISADKHESFGLKPQTSNVKEDHKEEERTSTLTLG